MSALAKGQRLKKLELLTGTSKQLSMAKTPQLRERTAKIAHKMRALFIRLS